ncbi:conserved hypothetical membrane protein [Formosa agariphila KMM 3901]|uniref:Conserved hypothetical membrane protein n=1 Tax=Formosa agariphila (strain DSM 15362 / KCTC 12365 / LMG 23005 / KMM 3901 / M-2Alg 35-1) TaxID=1347342 RepID=T2KK13_FORAG|nr:DUF6787 family protein [Formosa agariphila]CDF79105.1 conserved hypothetical membrane protein [Formosa agariphila KMM 3901]
MEKFKQHWEITKNWQFIFPIAGVLILIYSALKISILIFGNNTPVIIGLSTAVFTFVLLKFFLFLFKKLEHKWVLEYKWEMIRVFMVFAITGSSSLFVGRPIIKWLGVTKDNLSPFLYWTLYIFLGIIFYQILLVFYGWLFGQFRFFWEFEKKMLRRFGLNRFVD